MELIPAIFGAALFVGVLAAGAYAIGRVTKKPR